MADVFRRGAKSVHIGTRRQLGLDVETIPECAFDKGGAWLPVIPSGPRCEACFGAVDRHNRRPGGKRSVPVAAATTAALLAVAVVVASSVDEPVNYFPTAAPSATFFATPVLVTPGPSFGSPRPSAAPVLTPAPPKETHNIPVMSPEPGSVPTYPPVPTWPPAPTFGPLPTLPPIVLPTLPPLPIECRHPGEHVGLVDLCKWPHQ